MLFCCCCFLLLFFLLLPFLFFGFLSFGCYLLTHVVILIIVSAINCVKRFSKNWKKKMTLCGCRDVKMQALTNGQLTLFFSSLFFSFLKLLLLLLLLLAFRRAVESTEEDFMVRSLSPLLKHHSCQKSFLSASSR